MGTMKFWLAFTILKNKQLNKITCNLTECLVKSVLQNIFNIQGTEKNYKLLNDSPIKSLFNY